MTRISEDVDGACQNGIILKVNIEVDGGAQDVKYQGQHSTARGTKRTRQSSSSSSISRSISSPSSIRSENQEPPQAGTSILETYTRDQTDSRYQWSVGQPLAKLHKFTLYTAQFKPKTAMPYFQCQDFEAKCSETLSRVVDPRDQDMVYYKDIDEDNIKNLAILDGYCWRYQRPHLKRVRGKDVVTHTFFAETDIPNLSCSKYRKYFAYQRPTRRGLLFYLGDHRFALRHPWTSSQVEEAERPQPPTKTLRIHPSQTGGSSMKANLTRERYQRVWDFVVLYRPELAYWDAADAVVREPLLVDPTPAEKPPGKVIVLDVSVHNEDIDDLPDVYTIPLPSAVSQEQPAHQDDPGTAAIDTADAKAEDVDSVIFTSTDDNTDSTSHGDPAPEDDLGTTTKPTAPMATAPMATAGQAKEYRKAIPGHKVKLYSPIRAKDILALKALGDRMDKWESVYDTQISNPQPNEVYFREFKCPAGEDAPFHLEDKEAKDGYTWRRLAGGLTKDWSMFNILFVNEDSEDNTLNTAWTKNFYIFRHEDKMIIHYKGTLKNVQ